MSTEWERFGAALRKYRVEHRGVTQRKIAEDAGISVTRLSDIERGKRPPLSFAEIEAACGGVAEDIEALINATVEPGEKCPTCGRALVASPAPAVEVRVRTGADGGPFVYLPRSQFNAGDVVQVVKITPGGMPREE